MMWWIVMAGVVIAGGLGAAGRPAGAQDKPAVAANPSGLPLPRYVSLKSDRVNLRKGPGVEYPTVWVYRRAGLPVEVVREFEGWREVRDAENVSGWVVQTLLSARRTALIEPWLVKADQPRPVVTLRADGRDTAPGIADVEAGVIANVQTCNGTWCQVTVDRFKGYVPQKRLWGVYEGETLK